MLSGFDRTDLPMARHHQSVGFPMSSYSMGSMNGSDMSQPSNQNETSFDYMPMQSSHRMRPSSSNMMGGSYSQQLQHQQHSQHQQYNDQSPMYAHASASSSFPGDSRNGPFSPGSTQGTRFWLHAEFRGYSHTDVAVVTSDAAGGHASFRSGDDVPLNLPHKRILDELQGARDPWKNDSPVSVTARIFRGAPPSQSTDDAVGSVGMGSSISPDSYKSSMPFYRQGASMSHFSSMEQVRYITFGMFMRDRTMR